MAQKGRRGGFKSVHSYSFNYMGRSWKCTEFQSTTQNVVYHLKYLKFQIEQPEFTQFSGCGYIWLAAEIFYQNTLCTTVPHRAKHNYLL